MNQTIVDLFDQSQCLTIRDFIEAEEPKGDWTEMELKSLLLEEMLGEYYNVWEN